MKRILEIKQKIGTLSKSSVNPFFKSQYLDLNDLLNAVEPLLWEYGLLLVQPIKSGLVCSHIIDTENNLILASSEIELPDIKDPQKLGSCITYFRRYTLKSLLAISEIDDDANIASKPEVKKLPNLLVESDEFKGALKKETTIEVLEEYFIITDKTKKEYNKQLNFEIDKKIIRNLGTGKEL